MTPLEESDSKSHDYIAAIDYRLTLFNNLIGHEKRKKAGTNRSYSLPLRQFYFKPLSLRSSHDYYQAAMSTNFALLSKGTGQEYVIVDPDTDSVVVHTSIIERVQCFDKSVQKKREANQQDEELSDDIMPSQVLLRSYRHSKDGSPSLARSWEDHFGNDTPFGPYDDLPPEDTRRMGVGRVSIQTFNAMDDERIVLKEKIIILCRLIGDQDGRECTEIIVWGDSGYKERSPSKRFTLKSMVRIPSQIYLNDVSSNEDKLYTTLFEDPYNKGNRDKRVYQFSLYNTNIEDGQQHYIQPECSFVAENDVTSIKSTGKNQLFVGSHIGIIELWDCSDKTTPNRVKRFDATNTFSSLIPRGSYLIPNVRRRENGILDLLIDEGRSHNMFVSLQVKENDLVLTLWRNSSQEADYQMMVKIKYECILTFACNGNCFLVLTYDKFGCLFMDIYHLLGSRYAINKYDDVKLPKGVEVTSLHPRGMQQIQFANRINLRHRIRLGTRRQEEEERFVMDMNDRFAVIKAHDGLVGSNGESKSGPGLMIIDFDEHASGLP